MSEHKRRIPSSLPYCTIERAAALLKCLRFAKFELETQDDTVPNPHEEPDGTDWEQFDLFVLSLQNTVERRKKEFSQPAGSI